MSSADISNRTTQCVVEDNDDDAALTLSAEAFKALQEFYAERETIETKKIDENWNMSQFWYDEKTSETLAKEVLVNAVKALNENSSLSTFNIGCISCPTLFKTLHEYLTVRKEHPHIPTLAENIPRIDLKLLEYDKRFAVYGENFYSFYDFKKPLELEPMYEAYFDMIVVDPPYLSSDCQIKNGMTIRRVGKPNEHKLLICTGLVMEDLLASSLKVKLVKFLPTHERNLANEYRCYANYETLFLD